MRNVAAVLALGVACVEILGCIEDRSAAHSHSEVTGTWQVEYRGGCSGGGGAILVQSGSNVSGETFNGDVVGTIDAARSISGALSDGSSTFSGTVSADFMTAQGNWNASTENGSWTATRADIW